MTEAESIQGERKSTGAIMLVTLLFLLLLTILGTSSLYLAYTEIVLAKSVESDARAFYIAGSGIEQVLYWFANPDKFTGSPADFFAKRIINNTSQNPDILISNTDSEFKIYGPVTPGALCTVESKGISGRIRRTVTVEMIEDTAGVKILPGSWRVD